MKKLNVLLTTAAILALTGCSSNSKPAETTAAQTTAAATTAAETTAAETTAAEKKDASGTLHRLHLPAGGRHPGAGGRVQ